MKRLLAKELALVKNIFFMARSALETISLTANEAQVPQDEARVLIADKVHWSGGWMHPRKPQDNNPLTFCHSTWTKLRGMPPTHAPT